MTYQGVSKPDNFGKLYICFRTDEKYGEKSEIRILIINLINFGSQFFLS